MAFKGIRFDDAEAPSGMQLFTSNGKRVAVAFAENTDPADLLHQLITGKPANEPAPPRQTETVLRQPDKTR